VSSFIKIGSAVSEMCPLACTSGADVDVAVGRRRNTAVVQLAQR